MDFKVGYWVANKAGEIGQVEIDEGNEKLVIRFVDRPNETKKIMASYLTRAEAPAGFSFPKISRTKTPGASTAPRNRKPPLDFDHLVQGFLRVFPDGFDGVQFQSREREYKTKAAALCLEKLSKERLTQLLEAGHVDEICDSAREVIQATNLIFRIEKVKLVSALKESKNQLPFAMGLNELLYWAGPEEVRFTAFVDLILGLDSCKWTVATYFQFLSSNGAKMFMKPAVMQPMADAVAVSLEYQVLPNWKTYERLQAVAKEVDSKLKDHGLKPQSGLDVQGFIWASIRINAGQYDKKE